MKKIIGLLLACFLAVPTVSFAHTRANNSAGKWCNCYNSSKGN